MFKFLNKPYPLRGGRSAFMVGADGAESLQELMAAAACHPRDGNPICLRVREVTALIAKDEQALLAAGKQALLVILTDGMPSDGDLWEAIEPLTKLPAKVVVRLCCDEPSVVRYCIYSSPS
jgi:hypothetical protein